jgi:hypothetical protein
MNTHFLKLISTVNRLNIAPRQLRANVERELVEAAREVVAADDQDQIVMSKAELESAIQNARVLLRSEKDPVRSFELVEVVRRLQARLPT